MLARDFVVRTHHLTVAAGEIVRLLTFGCVVPFVVTGSRHEAASSLESIAEHRLLGHSLSARVKRREPHFLDRLNPPGGDDAPSHWDEYVLAIACDNRINVRGGADVETRLQIRRRRREAVQRVDLPPSVIPCEASAHGSLITGLRLEVVPPPHPCGVPLLSSFHFVSRGSPSGGKPCSCSPRRRAGRAQSLLVPRKTYR
jgi:hypothetical protein